MFYDLFCGSGKYNDDDDLILIVPSLITAKGLYTWFYLSRVSLNNTAAVIPAPCTVCISRPGSTIEN